MSGGSPLDIGPSVGEVMGQTPSTGLRHSSIKCGHGYVGWFSGRSVGEVMGMSGGSLGDLVVGGRLGVAPEDGQPAQSHVTADLNC